MKCPIFRTLSMVVVAGAVLGITSFAAAGMITLGNSENWEYKYEGDEVIGDSPANTLPGYTVAPGFGGTTCRPTAMCLRTKPQVIQGFFLMLGRQKRTMPVAGRGR